MNDFTYEIKIIDENILVKKKEYSCGHNSNRLNLDILDIIESKYYSQNELESLIRSNAFLLEQVTNCIK